MAFIREQRGVNAAVHNPCAARAGLTADFVASPRITGVDADADDVALGDCGQVDRVERLVDDDRIAPLGTGRGRQHVKPIAA